MKVFLRNIKLKLKINGPFLFCILAYKGAQNRLLKLSFKLLYKFDNIWIDKGASLLNIKLAKIGKNFSAQKGFRFEIYTQHGNNFYSPHCLIGDNMRISDFTHIGCCNQIIIGDNVLVGSKVLITDHVHGVYSGEVSHQSSPTEEPDHRTLFLGFVEIGDNVFIGDNVVILPNVKICKGSIIASNTVISSNTLIPEGVIVAGCPPKIIKRFDYITNSWIKVDDEVCLLKI